jgi:lipopolysaccharide transport system permease protein
VTQELRQRYAGSVLGLGWAVLYPFLLLALYAVVYLFIFRVRPASLDEKAYVVLVFSGLVPVLAFVEALMTSAGSLSANRHLLLNTVFPAELIPLRAVIAAQVPSLAALAITIIAAALLGRISVGALLVLPLVWVLLVMFAAGIAWFLSLITLVFRDIQQAIGLLGMVLLILSPVAFTPDMVPERLKALLYANPLSYFVMSYQRIICYGEMPRGIHLAVAAALGVGLYIAGYAFFRRAKHAFFDYA